MVPFAANRYTVALLNPVSSTTWAGSKSRILSVSINSSLLLEVSDTNNCCKQHFGRYAVDKMDLVSLVRLRAKLWSWTIDKLSWKQINTVIASVIS